MKHTILCVDDESDNVDALERLFRRNYRVLKATSGQQALDLLSENAVTVIISDQRMPHMSGVEFLSESIKTQPAAIRILLTGYTDIESVIAAINAGQIYRYVTKPWDPVDLANAVDKAVERFELGEELREKNIALQNALDELQTLDEAKSNFMILINHELKTPLTSILSFSDLMAESKLDADQQRYLSRIKTSAQRLHELVQDSLELVMAEIGQMKIDKRALKSRPLVDPIPDSIARLAATRGVRVELHVENQDVYGDERGLRNVIRRLLHNAVKFSNEGATVHILGKSDKTGYKFTFVNQGPSVDARKIEKILKPFTLDESAMHHSTGTGLGLSVSQAILKLHDSKIDFKSEGSQIVVSFHLPAQK